MDEILATIRRIISEDEQASGPPAGAAKPGGGAEAGPANPAEPPAGNEVLELTHALNEDGSVRRLAPIGAGVPGPEAAPEPGDAAAGPRREPEFPPADRGPVRGDERLVSEVTSLAAAAAFARVAAAPRERREPPMLGGRPLEDAVCELLRPLLQAWLDENLPGIVERLVQAELARIAARSGPV